MEAEKAPESVISLKHDSHFEAISSGQAALNNSLLA
jgi:hypothetical protein